jgi:succinate-semialdehyde dehydrogenase / glutarate-semialdehyde dehydrogenase
LTLTGCLPTVLNKRVVETQPSTANQIALFDPRTGVHDANIFASTAVQLGECAAALRGAQPAFAELSIVARALALRELAQLIETDAPLMAALITDTGRVAISQLEVRAVCASLRRWAEEAPTLGAVSVGQSVIPEVHFQTFGVPYGLVGVISPWNFPLLLAMIDTIPALLAGCAVWVKPSEVAARFVRPLNAIVEKIPALRAVLRFVEGAGDTGSLMIERSDALCFTGSVATGKKVYRACAEAFIPAFLELGGKDPLVVLPGADLARASDIALRASVIATGQACQSIERIYVHHSQLDEFLALLVAKAQRVLLSTSSGGHLGPLIFARQAQTIQAQLEQAVSLGAVVHCGGAIERHGGGFWIRPTVLSKLTHAMAIMRDETFGPILPVMSYDSLEQAIALANDSEYGLSAAVVGPDESAAVQFAQCLHVGAVSVNDAALTSVVFEAEKQAFGNSGLGQSRMGASGYSRFLRKKSILIQRGAPLSLAMLNEVDPPAQMRSGRT